jgi:hypothetical protein
MRGEIWTLKLLLACFKTLQNLHTRYISLEKVVYALKTVKSACAYINHLKK